MRYFDRARLDRMFHPRTVAVIGAKKASNYGWLRRNQMVKGKLYSVQIDPSEIPGIEALGIPNYKSILDIPEPVDYVIFAIPRKITAAVFAECIRAGVGGVSLYTSGFAETDEEGIKLQETLSRMSRESGVPLIGPNAMGVYSPGAGVRQGNEQPYGEVGPVGFLGQSGTHSSYFSSTLHAWYGIKMAKGVSFGNSAVLDAGDWMEYIGEDPGVRIVSAYLEGIGDPQRFSRVLKRVAAQKPVIIWKGGRTEDGFRASQNHTGSAPVTPEQWAGILKETGAIGVDDLEGLVDTTAAILKLPPLKGPRGGLICMTGGQSVIVTDAFCLRGLRVPSLTDKTYKELETFFDVIGGSYRNPLDVGWMADRPELVDRELRILEADDNTDFVSMEFFVPNMPVRRAASGRTSMQAQGEKLGIKPEAPAAAGPSYLDILEAHQARAKKPFFTMITAVNVEKEAVDLREALIKRGVLAFPSTSRAAVAYRKALDYWERPHP